MYLKAQTSSHTKRILNLKYALIDLAKPNLMIKYTFIINAIHFNRTLLSKEAGYFRQIEMFY